MRYRSARMKWDGSTIESVWNLAMQTKFLPKSQYWRFSGGRRYDLFWGNCIAPTGGQIGSDWEGAADCRGGRGDDKLQVLKSPLSTCRILHQYYAGGLPPISCFLSHEEGKSNGNDTLVRYFTTSLPKMPLMAIKGGNLMLQLVDTLFFERWWVF